MRSAIRTLIVLLVSTNAPRLPGQAISPKESFKATWRSLGQYQVPDWYKDAKFGIFIHWGVYSVPAFGNEWYPRQMYRTGTPEFKHHVETFGPQKAFGYKDFIPLFKAENFDPGRWAELFRNAGAKYVVPVAEHHDGFAMYDCSLSDWCAAKMGPKRDILGELAEAVRSQGLVFGLSSHRAEHWWFMNGGVQFDSDVRDPAFSAFYGPAMPDTVQPDAEYLDDWYGRCVELVDRYRPQVFWFDWWIEQPVFRPYLQKFAAYYYNRGLEWNRGVAINFKNKTFPDHTAVLDIERGQLSGIRDALWQTDTAVSKNSWGYVEGQDYKTPDSIVDDLIDIVSKNGVLLLNIGPRPDGTIPEPEQEILLDIGGWLAVNGEAVYGTRPWKVFGEGPTDVVEGSFNDTKRQAFTGEDIRFTTKDGILYALALARPEGGRLCIRSLAKDRGLWGKPIKNVALVGSTVRLHWTLEKEGLVVRLPRKMPGDYAFAFRID
jgi:alpha-L-fucosidase